MMYSIHVFVVNFCFGFLVSNNCRKIIIYSFHEGRKIFKTKYINWNFFFVLATVYINYSNKENHFVYECGQNFSWSLLFKMWSVRIPKFQTGSRLVSVSVTESIHFVFNANPYLLWNMRSYLWMIKSQLRVKQVCLPSIIIYQTLQAKKKNFEKNCEAYKFSRNTILLQSVSVTALSIHGSFCACCIIYTFFSCLQAYFYVSPSLMVVSTV